MCGYGHETDTSAPEVIWENELFECNHMCVSVSEH